MSFSKHGISDPTSEDVEQEDEVKVEEASVNLECVKRELDEEELEFEHMQYKLALTLENVFGESSTQQRSNQDSLIGFLDGDVIMETGRIKLEDVKEENKDLIRKTIGESDCNKCGGNYQGYCLNCSSLSHILNNLTPNLNPEPVLNTTPRNTFEIREVSRGCAVFALKTLPQGIILGPFEGIAPIESTTGLRWKIKNRKLVNDQNGNWMKYIESVAKQSTRNLEVFQIDGMLYFKTSRELQEGEELLVCYREEEEEVLKSENEEVFYLVPVKKVEYPKVFACTLCCLGFRLEKCLVEHKNKCPQGDHGGSIKDFEIIQCCCCKLWLEKEEYLESHMMHCLENYNRSSRSRNLPDFTPTTTDNEEQVHENEEITTSIDVNASYSTLPTEIMDSNNCFFRTQLHTEEYFHDKKTHSNTNNLKSHLGTLNDIKHFQCDICKRRFGRKCNLKVHIKNKHSDASERDHKCSECSYQTNYKGSLKIHMETVHSNTNDKEYKCSECSYQTNRKSGLKIHLGTHTKDLQCDMCKQRFGQKRGLTLHIKDKHSNTNEKDYKCSECTYQTNHKGNLKIHMETVHSNTNDKKYKCSECCYQTNSKSGLKIHLGTHTKDLQCDICKQRFGQKNSLQLHIKNKHSNTNEKDYKCSECSYQTNHKGNLKIHMETVHLNTNDKNYKCSECCYQTNRKSRLKIHLGTHTKDLQCDICKQRFGQKNSLQLHIKNKHSNENEKDYKCSECSYQTNVKFNLKVHLIRHTGIKHFQCDICQQRFAERGSLNVHIKNKHSNTNEKDYKCSECPYQTNLKCNLKAHLATHTDVKDFECGICKQRFGQKSYLKVHIKNKHSNPNEKVYKCSECSYQTNVKANLKVHLIRHTGIKDFECDICKQRFVQKSHLKVHIKNKHSNPNEKEYKCSECSYQTNVKANLKVHLIRHIKHL